MTAAGIDAPPEPFPWLDRMIALIAPMATRAPTIQCLWPARPVRKSPATPASPARVLKFALTQRAPLLVHQMRFASAKPAAHHVPLAIVAAVVQPLVLVDQANTQPLAKLRAQTPNRWSLPPKTLL